MKICTKCGIEKNTSEYFIRDNNTGRLHAQCKACFKIHRQSYSADHYLKYGDEYRLRAKVRRARVKIVIQNEMLSYLKNATCVVCGENDIRTLEFDHIDPNKKSFGIAKAVTNGTKWVLILAEIQKCRLLCANCHKKHTASQQNWYRTLVK